MAELGETCCDSQVFNIHWLRLTVLKPSLLLLTQRDDKYNISSRYPGL